MWPVWLREFLAHLTGASYSCRETLITKSRTGSGANMTTTTDKKKHKGTGKKMESLENRVAPLAISNLMQNVQLAQDHEGANRIGATTSNQDAGSSSGASTGGGGSGGGGSPVIINLSNFGNSSNVNANENHQLQENNQHVGDNKSLSIDIKKDSHDNNSVTDDHSVHDNAGQTAVANAQGGGAAGAINFGIGAGKQDHGGDDGKISGDEPIDTKGDGDEDQSSADEEKRKLEEERRRREAAAAGKK